MYQAGDYIIYGNSGVCHIKSIGSPDIIPSTMESKQYYTLSPLSSTETIYTPVDTKVFMRPLMTREEVKKLIEQFPLIEEEDYDQNSKWSANLYEAALQQNNCETLIKLIKKIYVKNQDAVLNKKKISETDLKYLRRAEELLYSEFAVVLGMTIDDVKQYVEGAFGKTEV